MGWGVEGLTPWKGAGNLSNHEMEGSDTLEHPELVMGDQASWAATETRDVGLLWGFGYYERALGPIFGGVM